MPLPGFRDPANAKISSVMAISARDVSVLSARGTSPRFLQGRQSDQKTDPVFACRARSMTAYDHFPLTIRQVPLLHQRFDGVIDQVRIFDFPADGRNILRDYFVMSA